MKILVTGSEGSLMQATIPKLIGKGHKVVGVDNLYRYGERLGIADNTVYDFYRDDLTDNEAVESIFNFERPDVVIQAAAKIYGVSGFHRYPADILGDDLQIQTNMLKASVKYDITKFVYISSSMVYESQYNSIDHPLTESLLDNYMVAIPKTAYGLSKYVGERLCQTFWEQYSLPYIIWRPFNIITPYEKSDEEIGISHVFADFITNIVYKNLQTIPVIGDGNQTRCFTWIDDVAQAIADHSIDSGNNEAFNLGNKEPFTMKELAWLIYDEALKLDLVTEKTLAFAPQSSYNDDVLVRIPSVDKARDILGWEPTKNTRESIQECLKQILQKVPA